MRRVRFYIFLRDVLYLSLLSFGGPQAHVTLFYKVLVNKRGYLKEEELVELNSFCNILPGPASTQTITAVGFKIGGPSLAFLTLLVWILPATLVMTAAAVSIEYLQGSLDVARFIQPMAVSFVAYAAFKVGKVALKTKTAIILFVISTIACLFIQYPGIFPVVLLVSGFITSFRYKSLPREERQKWNVEWGNLILYASIFIGAALLGQILENKPIKLFENFFRIGSLIFGGGQPLSGLLYKEFVTYKGYLQDDEFKAGYALLQALPGPLFSFSSFVGSLSLREYGIWGQIGGGFLSAGAIFLPGTLMIFFIIRFWEHLKKYRAVKASLEGVNAANVGIILATAIILFIPSMQFSGVHALMNYLIMGMTFLILLFTRIPPPYIVIVGLLAGFLMVGL